MRVYESIPSSDAIVRLGRAWRSPDGDAGENNMPKTRLRGMMRWAMLSLVMAMSPVMEVLAQQDDEPEAQQASSRLPQTLEERLAAVEKIRGAPWAKGGADTCLACHGEYSEYDVLPMFRTKHGTAADARSPMAQNQCESCHGPGGDHAVLRLRRGEERPPMLNFGKDAWTPAAAQNETCLTCHRTHSRIQWEGSTHQFNEVACASCHKVHVAHDPVLDERQQAGVCYECHIHQRAQFEQISHHPVREGQMVCGDCHEPHGTSGSDLLVKATLRETCTECHAEKRGPFLWEHAPAAEDCGLCHRPHGSSHPALLKRRSPQLCQECHSQFNHPSVGFDGSFAASSRFVTAKGCLNCHSQVHGTNHPSGVSLTR